MRLRFVNGTDRDNDATWDIFKPTRITAKETT